MHYTQPNMDRLALFAHHPADTAELRSEKVAAFLIAGSCCLAGMVWTAMYAWVFGWGLTAALPLSFVVIVGSALVIAHRTKNHRIAIHAQILCIIYITAFIQWSIGGVFDSGFVMVWSLLGPLCALMFFRPRQAALWFLLFFINILITVLFDEVFSGRAQSVSDQTRLLFFVMNMGVLSFVVFIFATYFVSSALSEREKANRLLLNVLPKEIAPILKESNRTIADFYPEASVLFADIVGSTPLFARLEPAEAVDWLNEVFSMFDRLVEKCGLEKIRTIGDNYMVAAGVPVPREDHALAAAQLGLDMLRGLEEIPPRYGQRMNFRIGIHSGPLVAGVIGKFKFHYDIWGDTVNTASRMESHGEVGRVQISRATYELVKDAFQCEPRGKIGVKGKGEMETWFLMDSAEK